MKWSFSRPQNKLKKKKERLNLVMLKERNAVCDIFNEKFNEAKVIGCEGEKNK